MNQLQKLRDTLQGLNISELARLSGIHRRQFQRVIHEEHSPTYKTLLKLQEAVSAHGKKATRRVPS